MKFIFLLFISISCLSLSKIKLENKPEKARETLLKYVPIGSSFLDAKIIMKENNFDCSMLTKGEFLNYKNIDYLYCDQYESKGFMISRRWQIAIILQKDLVRDVQVTTGLLGP